MVKVKGALLIPIKGAQAFGAMTASEAEAKRDIGTLWLGPAVETTHVSTCPTRKGCPLRGGA